MSSSELDAKKEELYELCISVKKYICNNEYKKSELLITEAMRKYPNAPEPHNLIGILFEKKGDHLSAMKHFRAAWALDPTYLPAQYNLNSFGSFFSNGKSAYCDSDCDDNK